MSTTDTDLSMLSIDTALAPRLPLPLDDRMPADRATDSAAAIAAIAAEYSTLTTSTPFGSAWPRQRRSGPGLTVRSPSRRRSTTGR